MKLARIAAAALLVLASACNVVNPAGPDLPETPDAVAVPADRPLSDSGTVHGSGG